MKKKILATILMCTMLLSLFGCSAKLKEIKPDYVNDAAGKDPLVICVDLEGSGNSMPGLRDKMMRELLDELEKTAGLTDVAIQFVPPDGSDRKTYIDRLKIEIMSGGGPDVFLVKYHSNDLNDSSMNLFEFPQKVMEAGMFLPLDEYMENNTRFTEWHKQTQGVLNAGRNKEGQQIIPLSYTLPLLVYEKETAEHTPNRELSWSDMLNDPALSPYALDLANCYDWDWSVAGGNGFTRYYMEFILGALADFENEKLLFTEEELLERVNEILALDTDDRNDVPEDDNYSGVEETIGDLFMQSYNRPMTLIPMYSDDGGVTAMIDAYAAVNRNTKRPEEAFAVIDILMSKKMQQSTDLYMVYIMSSSFFPMHEEIFQKDTPLNGNPDAYILDETFKELCEVRGQITGANFSGRYRNVLNEELLIRCRKAEEEGSTVEAIVHEIYADLERRVKE